MKTKQKTFDYWSEGVEFLEAIATAHDLRKADIKTITVKDDWGNDKERWRIIAHYR